MKILARLKPIIMGIGLILLGVAHYLFRSDTPWVASNVGEWLDHLVPLNLPSGLFQNFGICMLLFLLGSGCVALVSNPPAAFQMLIPTTIDEQRKQPLLAWAIVIIVIALFSILITRMMVIDASIWPVVIWLTCLLLFSVALFLFDRQRNVAFSLQIESLDWGLMMIVIMIGLAVTIYRLADTPNSMWGDEGRFWEAANAIATNPERPSLFAIGVYSLPIASSFFQGAILWIFKPSFWSWRFSSGFAALLAVFPTYLLAKELFQRRVALVSAIGMISMPFFIAFARIGYNNSQALLPAALSLYFFYAGIRRKSLLYLGWAGMAAGLGAYTYPAAQVCLFAAGPILAFLCIRSIKQGRKQLFATAGLVSAFLVAWLVTSMPLRVYISTEAPDQANVKFAENVFFNSLYAHNIFPTNELYRDYPPIVIGQETLFYRPDLYGLLLLRGTIQTFLAFHSGLNVTQHYMNSALPGPLGVIWYTIGLAVALRYMRSPQMVLLLLWLVSGAISLSIANAFPPRQTHLVAIIPVLAILIGVGLVEMVDAMTAWFQHPWVKIGMLTFLLMISATIGLWNYFVVVQNKYIPYEDDVIGFDAMALEQPRNLIFVVKTAEKLPYQPWLVANIPNQANYSTILPDDLRHNLLVLDPNQSTTIYCSSDDAAIVEAWILRTTGLPVIPHLYKDQDQKIFFASFELDQYKYGLTKP